MAPKDPSSPPGGSPPSSQDDQIQQLIALVKAQGEQLKQFQEEQANWRAQWETDMATAPALQTVPYEDMASRQEREAERLAREIDRTTHQAASALLKKIRNKLKAGTWDIIAQGMVKAYQGGTKKIKAADFQAIKDAVKGVVVHPLDAAGLFASPHKIQSSVWKDVEAALDRQMKAGLANPSPVS